METMNGMGLIPLNGKCLGGLRPKEQYIGLLRQRQSDQAP